MADQPNILTDQHEQPDPLDRLLGTSKTSGTPAYPVSEDNLARQIAWQDYRRTLDRKMQAELGSPAPVGRTINREVNESLIENATMLAQNSGRQDLMVLVDRLKVIKSNPAIYPDSVVNSHRQICDEIYAVTADAAKRAKAVLILAERLIEALNREATDNNR